MISSRIDRLIESLNLEHIPLLALNPGASLYYFTGLEFHLMERPVILLVSDDGKIALVHPSLESGKLSQTPLPIKSFPYPDNPSTWDTAFFEAAKYMNRNGKIGIEPGSLRILEYHYLEAVFTASTFVDSSSIIARSRTIKDSVEVSSMRKATQVAQDALQAVIPVIKPGLSEKEIASELIYQLLRAGSQSDLPFSPIVASGPNSANPHAIPGDRTLRDGDLLVIDWGARVNHYCSDLTRTFGLGKIDPELIHIYQIVRSSNEAGRLSVFPGKSAGSIDQAARAVIQSSGYGSFFTHRTGHGLGLDAHEPPFIFGENTEPLRAGMTFTIEPGIYLPGKGGVRIEDNMLVVETGAECLSDYSRELQLLG